MQSTLSLIDSLINTFAAPINTETSNHNKINNNIGSTLSKKNMEKLMSYFLRNCNMKTLLHLDIIEIICKYQQVVKGYQLEPIPVMHPCVQSFQLPTSDHQILIQIASLFFLFNTKLQEIEYKCICRLFEGIKQEYGYHTIHIPQQNKLYACHGKSGNMRVEEIIYDEPFKPITQNQHMVLYTRDMFGVRSIVLNDKYFLIFCDDNILHIYNYVTNVVVTLGANAFIKMFTFANDFKWKSCGVVLLPTNENEFLIFGNNAMYKIKVMNFPILTESRVLQLRENETDKMFVPDFHVTKIDNELFKDDFILHEFGHALCDEFMLIFGGNYNDIAHNPIFSDDIYIYNIETNRWYKSKIKMPFVFNVKNNNIMFDSKRRMIHLIGANEFVDARYDRDICPSSRCHYMFDADVLIDRQNMDYMEPYVYENKKLIKTDYNYQIIQYI
eukprot:269902_1